MRRRAFGLLLVLEVLLTCPAWGQPQLKEFNSSAEANEFFEKRVRPLLANKCFACHGSKLQMADLNLSTAPAFFKGSDNGPIILKGEPENSKLIEAVGYQGKIKMPPSGKLRDDEIADLVAWIKMGAPWPDADLAVLPAEKPKEYKFTEEQKNFWTFRPIKDSAPPPVKDRSWCKSPIDRFILAELEKKGLAPAKPAGKLALLRRATFDLTGLPPTEKEIQEFLNDPTPSAFAKVVDRLLSSPRYGERWGRHWLDVARYADSAGADEDIRYPYAYRYRDYVIEAFNKDLPYNEFVKQQLAGDLLPVAKPEEVNVTGIVATGFLQVGPKLLAEQDKPKMVYDMVDEQIDVTARAFMGLTVACARCHDHKFDPIPTRDYYSLASIFASTKSLSKVDSLVSQLYFAPLVPKETADRYNQAQEKITAKQEDIQEVIDAEAARHGSALLAKLPEYLVAAWQYENRPGSMANIKISEFAQSHQLDETVLERWIEYLKPTVDVRPHLKRWYQVSEAATLKAGGASEARNLLPEPPSELVEVALEYQKELQVRSSEYVQIVADWRQKVREARRQGMMPPEKPIFEVAKYRFLTDVIAEKGPMALPEKDSEKQFSEPSKFGLARLRKELETLKQASPPEPPMACAVTEGAIVQQRVLVRGNWANPGEEAPKQFLRIIAGENQTPITQGSGRLQLAEWLIRPEHPLTSRVMVNRLWQWHFGEGLVRTPSNFGKLGETPSHSELLDFLAKQFVEKGWSTKDMHRLVMLSSTYQMSSEPSKKAAEIDPQNRLISHMNRRRLDVEEIRDGMLSLTGELDLAMGGTLQSGFGTDEENSVSRLSINPNVTKRRTVYLPMRRSNLSSILNLFDFGDATTPGEGRARTNVAPQALYMMNGSAVSDRARQFARNLLASESKYDDSRRIETAYMLALGRSPDINEIKESLQYIESYKKKFQVDAKANGTEVSAMIEAWQSLCHVLLSSNEFIYVD